MHLQHDSFTCKYMQQFVTINYSLPKVMLSSPTIVRSLAHSAQLSVHLKDKEKHQNSEKQLRRNIFSTWNNCQS